MSTVSEIKEGQLIRKGDGKFVQGTPGGPGRPKGSKNQITIYKLAGEEAFRERNAERIQTVLDMIIDDALDGDKAARKLIWEAAISKMNVQEDKSHGQRQSITVHRMEVKTQAKESDVDNTNLEDNDNG